MRVSKDKKIVFLSTPKCGSHTGLKLMSALGAIPCNAQHAVTVPEEYIDYTIFTFARNPYDRVASMYNWISNTVDGDDFLRVYNSKYYLEHNAPDFKTFCKWLGTVDTEDYFSEFNTSIIQHLKESNVYDKIKVIKLEDEPLVELNKFMEVTSLSTEMQQEHKSFWELADEECLYLINKWASEDFEEFNYEKCKNL